MGEGGNAVSNGGPFVALLAVQELDTSIAQLRHRKTNLPERRELETVRAGMAKLRASIEETRAKRQELVDRQTELEVQAATITGRRKALEEKLYGARGAGRDLQAMSDEIGQLNRRLDELEMLELGLIEEQEPLDTELEAKTTGQRELEEAASRVSASVAAADSEIDAEIGSLLEQRNASAKELPSELAEKYESLRSRLNGVGAARLIGNRCDGCHLELPSVEVDRIKHLPKDAVVTCDQCGRILIRG